LSEAVDVRFLRQAWNVHAEGCRGDIDDAQQPAKLLAPQSLRYAGLDPDLTVLEWLKITTHIGTQPRFAGCLASSMPPLQPSARIPIVGSID
jgi:hypothetical protein